MPKGFCPLVVALQFFSDGTVVRAPDIRSSFSSPSGFDWIVELSKFWLCMFNFHQGKAGRGVLSANVKYHGGQN